MWCVTGLNWPAGEDHDSLPPSPWSSCWLPLAHEWVAVVDVLIVSSLAEESPQSPAGVVWSASYPPAAAGPVNRAADHIPCSLYLSTAHQNVIYSLFPGGVGFLAPVLLTSCLLLVNASSSPLSEGSGTLCSSWVHHSLRPSPHSISPHLLPGLGERRGAVIFAVHLYHCQCVHLSLKLL